tara:strand:- start:5234 stop:5752 length:519 start_codon:yes stop_codon:yes gene_type:complete
MSSIIKVELLAENLMSKNFTVKAGGSLFTISAKSLGYTFKWDNAKRRSGRISYTTKVISLSKSKVKVNLHQVDTVIKNTILHEIAHAFSFKIYGREGRGHGNKWQSIAKQIGCSGDRCTSGYEESKSKYTLHCTTCDKKSTMHRKSKYSHSCGVCSPKVYNKKYELKIIQNF